MQPDWQAPRAFRSASWDACLWHALRIASTASAATTLLPSGTAPARWRSSGCDTSPIPRPAKWSSLKRPLSRKPRSEEHTSELQSLRHLVCRLLLEKKKKDTHMTAREQVVS